MMDKYTVQGVKKLLALTRTKIRLAEEAGTMHTKPRPLPLVEFFSKRKIETVADAKNHALELKDSADFSDERRIAETVFQLLDVIEGVKYGFEPKESCALVDDRKLNEVEVTAKQDSSSLNILLMTKNIPDGINLFVGENPPVNAVHLGVVPSSLAFFLNFAFHSDYFFDGKNLKNINSVLGNRTLLLKAIHDSLGVFGVELKTER